MGTTVPDMLPQNNNPSESLIKCLRCDNPPDPMREGLCDTCHWASLVQDQQKQARIEANKRRKAELVEIMGGRAASDFSVDAFKPFDANTAKALLEIKNFHPSTGNLYLFGITGCGKTHLACAVAMRCFDEGKTVFFFPSGPALSRWFRKIDPDEEAKRIKELARADLLVVNELGIGRDTEFSMQILQEVVDARIMRGQNGAVFTSNFHPDDLGKKMNDDRLPSRFMGLCKVIEVGVKDYRREFRKP